MGPCELITIEGRYSAINLYTPLHGQAMHFLALLRFDEAHRHYI